MKIRLIDDWKAIARNAWSMYAAYLFILLGVVCTLMALVSDWLQKLVGPFAFSAVFIVCGFTFGVARLKKQAGTEQ